MAIVAIKLALAHLLWGNDVRISGSLVGGGSGEEIDVERRREGEYQMWGWTLEYRDGPTIEIKARH